MEQMNAIHNIEIINQSMLCCSLVTWLDSPELLLTWLMLMLWRLLAELTPTLLLDMILAAATAWVLLVCNHHNVRVIIYL